MIEAIEAKDGIDCFDCLGQVACLVVRRLVQPPINGAQAFLPVAIARHSGRNARAPLRAEKQFVLWRVL